MTPGQEQKLDKVLELTAQHSVQLVGLKEWLSNVHETQGELEGKVIRLEAAREDHGKRNALRVAGFSALASALSALAAWSSKLFSAH